MNTQGQGGGGAGKSHAGRSAGRLRHVLVLGMLLGSAGAAWAQAQGDIGANHVGPNPVTPSAPATPPPGAAVAPAPGQAALPALGPVPTPAAPPARKMMGDAPAADATAVLLQQASFWHDQYQPEKAIDALNRALRLDPSNADALSMLAEVQAEQGNTAAAQANLSQLQTIRPNDPRIPSIAQTIASGPITNEQLIQARKLGTEGHNAEAVAAYQRIFRSDVPPAKYAVEYFETLAGTEGGWDVARTGLGQYVIDNPQDTKGQLAYAQVLSYRGSTRAEAIERLNRLVLLPEVAVPAAQSLRQAMLWLPADSESLPLLEAYVAAHPQDGEIAQRMATAKNPPLNPDDIMGQKRSGGFAKLNHGELDQAADAFQDVLNTAPEDPDALGGLGIVRLRQGKTDEARALLQRAIAADPEHKDRWQSALAGTQIGQQYAQVRVLADRGDYAAAERLLNRLSGGPGRNAGATMMLADIQARAGNLPEAEASYRAILAHAPNNATALMGLAGVLTREGRDNEADDLFVRAEATGNRALVGRARAQELSDRAEQISDPVAQAGLYRAAVQSDPNNPWIRLNLARALLKLQQPQEARQVMADGVNAPHRSPDAIQAAIIFANEINDPALAASLIGHLPAGARTAQMRTVLAEAQVQRDIDANLMSFRMNPLLGRQKLLALAAARDPTGAHGVQVARAFLAMNDKLSAREAIATATAVNRSPSASVRLAYAGVLLNAGAPGDADTMLAGLDSTPGVSVQDRKDAVQLQAGIAIRSSDQLNQQGRQADAYDQLAPALANAPSSPDLNMALARLYSSAEKPTKAMQINLSLLQRDPNNLDVRQATVDAAIQAEDWSLASRLVHEAVQMQADDPRTWLIAADLARARGNDGEALDDLRRARALRQRQLGFTTGANWPGAFTPRIELTQNAGYAYDPATGVGVGGNEAMTPQLDTSNQAQILGMPPVFAAPPPTPLAIAPAAAVPSESLPQAGFTQPAYAQPSYAQPTPMAPSYAAPSYASPSYAPPSSTPRSYAQPAPAQPRYAPPSYAQPSYAQPSYALPVPAQPSYAQPNYAPPTYAQQPSYAQPAYGQSAFSQPAYGSQNAVSSTMPRPQQGMQVAPLAQQVMPPDYPPNPITPPSDIDSQTPPPTPLRRRAPLRYAAAPAPVQAPAADSGPVLLPVTAPLRVAAPARAAPLMSADMPMAPPPIAPASYDMPPPDVNPFRPGASGDLSPNSTGMSGVLSGTQYSPGPRLPSDPLTQRIDTQISQLENQVAPTVQAGLGLIDWSGSAGTSQLTDLMMPVEATFSPEGVGKLKLTITPTYLTAGSVGTTPANLATFGTLPVYALGPNTPHPADQNAAGIGADLSYNWRWLTADVGTTPVGFRAQNVVGGLEFAPQLSPNLRLRVLGERRAVTQSLLSYAGTVDPGTGQMFGGVLQTRAHAQLELTKGLANFYAGGGFDVYNGKNVVSNSEVEFGAGGSYLVYQNLTDQIRAGVDLVYFAYQHNLDYFTMGQGGYFSPQTYVAGLFPVSFTRKTDDLVWSVGATAGLQAYHENTSNVFPGDPQLQSILAAEATTNSAIITAYPSVSATGFSGGVNGSVDYALTPSMHVGANGNFQHAGNWSEATGLVYAKYIFNGAQ